MFDDFDPTNADLLKSPVLDSPYPGWITPILKMYLNYKAHAELQNAKEMITPQSINNFRPL